MLKGGSAVASVGVRFMSASGGFEGSKWAPKLAKIGVIANDLQYKLNYQYSLHGLRLLS